MKHLRETFTDKEFEAIRDAKETSGLSWHDFILKVSSWYFEMPVGWKAGNECYQRKFNALEVKTE